MNELNILYQFDDKYAPYAGISMTSLLANNRMHKVNIFCAALDVSDENRRRIEETVNKEKQSIIWVDIQNAMEQIKRLGVGSWNGSLATWIKIFILEQFSTSVNRLLYIDCDTIILGDLKDLFELDMEGNPIGAVLDSVGQYNKESLGTAVYYNAGVMLINLDYFRKYDLNVKMMEHLKKNRTRYSANDQDLMNDFFDGRIYKLPPQYNLQGFQLAYSVKNYFKVYKFEGYYLEDEIRKAKEKPIIIHFFRMFGCYPWEKGNKHSAKVVYEEWKKKSLWNDVVPITNKQSLVFKIEYMLYVILPEQIFLKIFRRIKEHK